MADYDPQKVLFYFAGGLITGYGPDTFITVERNEDGFSTQVGAGGEVTRVQNRNRTGTVTLTLMHSAQSNDFLSAIAVQDELLGTGVSELFIKEANGTTQCLASRAWIRKLPSAGRAKEAGTVEWVFECADLEIYNGGLI